MRDQSCAPGGRCSNKGSQEPSPAAVALNNQLQVQLALKRARQVASLQQQQTTWGPTHPFPWSITGGSVVPISTCTQPGAVGTLPTVPEPFALSPISSSSGGSGGYQSRTYANQGIPAVRLTGLRQFDQQMQYINADHATAQELQEAMLLQQQQAEVDSALSNMLALWPQLAATRSPAAPPAPTPVSRATAALGLGLTPQFNSGYVPVGPHPASPAAAAAAGPVGVSAAAAAQVQLAQLQVQQQQLLSVEQQLQLEIQAQLARLLAMV